MNLCVRNIVDWLEERGVRGTFCLTEDSPNIRSVEWLLDENIQPGKLYVVPAGYNPSAEVSGTIVTYENGILYFEKEEPEHIFNELVNVFDYYNRMEGKLLEAALRPNALVNLSNIAQEIFYTAVIIFDEYGKILARSARCSDDILMSCRGRATGTVIDCDLGEFPYKKLLARCRDRKSPYILKSGLLYMEQKVGEICLYQYENELNVGVFYMFHIFSMIVNNCIALNSDQYYSAACLEQELIRLLNGGMYETRSLLLALGSRNWEVSDRYRLAALGENDFDRHTEGIARLKMRSACYSFLYGETISGGEYMLILCNLTEDPEIMAEVETQLCQEETPGILAVSTIFCNLANVCQYLHQIRFALKYAEEHHLGKLYCEDIVQVILAAQVKVSGRFRDLIHPDIHALKSCDAKNHTDYLGTFLVFLFSGGNYAAAAGLLSIHQNTLYYRVRKIEDMISGNLFDMDYREQMLYSLLLV